MIARQVGEAGSGHRQPFGAILVEPMAAGFKAGMGDAFALQAGHIGQERHHIRRGQPGCDLVMRGGHPQRADAGGIVPGQLPQLPGQLCRAGLAIGAGDGDRGGRKWPEELRCQPGEQCAGFVCGNVQRAGHLRLWPRHHRNRTMGNGGGDEILPIHPGALKGTKNRAPGHLAMVEGKAGHLSGAAAGPQIGQPGHQCPPLGCGRNRPLVSRSRVTSGTTPNCGPMRSTMRLMAGAIT